MNKLIKIGATFLLSLCCLTPFTIKANEDVFTIEINGEEYELPYVDENTPMLMLDEFNTFSYYASAYEKSDGSIVWSDFVTKTITVNPITQTRLLIYLPSAISEGTYDITLKFRHHTTNKLLMSTLRLYEDENGQDADVYINDTVSRPNTGETIFTFSDVSLNTDKVFIRVDNVVDIAQSSDGNYYLTQQLYSMGFNDTGMSQLMSGIISWLEIINTRLMGINTNISTTVSSVRIAIEDGFSNLSTWISDQTYSLGGQISFMRQSLELKLDSVINAIRGDNQKIDSSTNVQNTTNQFQDTSNQYNDIESGLVEDFQNNLGNIQLDNDLYQNNDFLNTGTFISTQMTRIYNSNDVVRMMITYGMIVGLAFTIIGISVKR